MHVLFNTARQAAAESATQLQENAKRILFILYLPKNSNSKDSKTDHEGP
jgi:hypothetical protein